MHVPPGANLGQFTKPNWPATFRLGKQQQIFSKNLLIWDSLAKSTNLGEKSTSSENQSTNWRENFTK